MARILIIDDEELARFTVRDILESANHEVFEATNGNDGLDLQNEQRCDLVITDIIMPEKGGLSTIVELKRIDNNLKVIAISGGGRQDGHDYLGRAGDLGADEMLAKPFSSEELINCVDSCLNSNLTHHEDSITAEDIYKRFVPKEFLKMIGVDDVSQVKLGDHVENQITVLFSDIRSFTTLSEGMTPGENFTFINSFLSELVPVIHEHGGLIDKFIGDAVMALFIESPDGAVRASLAMLETLDEMNSRNDNEAPIRIGIGLNTGMVMMGTVGSKERMETTVIGDAVNLSSRLESLTKTYKTPLLISEATLNALNDPSAFNIRFVDRLQVKGKHRAISVYEVFDNDPKELCKAKRKTKEPFQGALAYFHLKEIDKAKALLDYCLLESKDDSVARLYLKRCDDYYNTGQFEGAIELNREVEWNDTYLLNIPKIDEQHKELLFNLNQLSSLVRNEDATGIMEIMDFLVSYTQIHFQTEEALMHKFDYPFTNEHIQEHGWFIEHYKKLREEIEQQSHDKLYLFFNINVFLVDWLLNHIAFTDNHMGKFIHQAGYKYLSDSSKTFSS